MEKKPMMAMVFVLIGVILVGSALAMNVYTTSGGGFEIGIGYFEEDASGVITTFLALTIVTLIMGVLALVFSLMTAMGKGKKMVGVIMSFLAMIFAIVGPIVFMVQVPGETGLDFWYTESVLGMEMSAGPGGAWYMVLISFVFFLIGLIVLATYKPAPAMAGYGAAGAYQQPRMGGVCPRCGQPTRFVPQYQRNYCDYCGQYI